MKSETFLDGRVTLNCGDCLDVLKGIPDASIDSVVTDPPYHLQSIHKRFAAKGRDETSERYAAGPYGRTAKGFMGKQWDGGDIAFRAELWAEVLRVLKPGGHLVAFGGTRTYHRMAVAIEDAGFEIRDMIGYLYGSGFPKSHNISRTIGICSCEAIPECDVRPVRAADVPAPQHTSDQCGEVLQPILPQQGSPPPGRQEPSNSAGHEEPIMEGGRNASTSTRKLRERSVRPMPAGSGNDGEARRLRDGAPISDGALDRSASDAAGVRASSGSPAAKQSARKPRTVARQPESQTSGAWENCHRCGKPLVPDGLGTALKPAQEPICLARKPLIGTVAQNVLEHGTGALNIDGCRVDLDGEMPPAGSGKNDAWRKTEGRTDKFQSENLSTPKNGRWPANVVHDGSDEVVSAFPAEAGAFAPVRGTEPSNSTVNVYGARDRTATVHHGDSGSAARFFYTAKADADDRLGSKHPTVKPLDLMQWLIRLVTPPGGTVLDPLSGTGTTGEAAWREGFSAILIEREAEYQADIRRRMKLCLSGPDERARESIKAKLADKPIDAGPLFGGG